MTEELKWIEDAIDELGQTAIKEDNTYWRATYTEEDRKGTALLKRWTEEAGFCTYFDQVGNLFGKIEGNAKDVVLTGSHRDTVRNGGRYDGALGIITAIAAGKALYQKKGRPEQTLEVVALCEEEASRFLTGYTGSRAITGTLREDDLSEKDERGISLKEALEAEGYFDGTLPKARSDIKQFLELHIEQGGVLEKTGKQAGIVTAIVGIFAGDIYFHGEQNHAGTTPMHMRKDPVPAAADFISALNRWALTKGTDLTCTIGNITIEPGKSNVIPARLKLTFDIRSGSQRLQEEARAKIEALLQQFQGYTPKVVYACQDPPASMDRENVSALGRLAKDQKIAVMTMISGAGHDAQIIAEKIRTNMIFVPSEKGISHSPLEFTSIRKIEPGYRLMKAFLEQAAWKK